MTFCAGLKKRIAIRFGLILLIYLFIDYFIYAKFHSEHTAPNHILNIKMVYRTPHNRKEWVKEKCYKKVIDKKEKDKRFKWEGC